MATYEMIDVITKLKSLGYYNEGLNEAKDAICKHCGCHFDSPNKDCDCAHDGADPADDCWVTPEAYKNMYEAKKKMVKDPKTGKMVPDYAIDGKGKDDLKKEEVKESIVREGIDTDSAFNAIMKKDPGDEGIGYVFDKFASKMTDQDADELAKKLGEFYPEWYEQHYQDEGVEEAITITADSPDDLPALQRIMKLAGMEPVGQDMMPQSDAPHMSMKSDGDINANDDCGCEDETPEGFANSMGKEKDQEKYSVDSLEKQYGKTEIKKLPRKFSMRGDNPLEDIEEALRQEYITFVNESADVKKKTDLSEQQLNEAFFIPAVLWGIRIGSAVATAYFSYATIQKLIKMYEDGNGDWSVYIQALPLTEETPSAECGEFFKQNGYAKEGWCNLTSDYGKGPDQAAVALIRNLYIDIALMFVGGGAYKFSANMLKKLKANKKAANDLEETGKKLVEELAKQKKVPTISKPQDITKVNQSVLKGIAAIKNADIMLDVQGKMRVLTNLKTGEKIFLDPTNPKVANLLKRLEKFDGNTDITSMFNTLKKYQPSNVSSSGIILPK